MGLGHKKAVSSLTVSPTTPTLAWRITREPYVDLSGMGAKKNGGRWNSPGVDAVYLSSDPALSVVEVLVHLDLPPELIPDDYVLMKVDLSDLTNAPLTTWLEDGPTAVLEQTESRAAGNQWIAEGRTPLFRVPSAIVPESFNLILNPLHSKSVTMSAVSYRPFSFDSRFFSS
jgi:RES domain-containing protein